MKILLGYCVLCIFLAKVQSKPQITKLFPVQELAAFHERTNEVKPLDKFLGKLRSAYNFVFNKPEDTSNVEKILSNNENQPNPEIEALKLIWANVISPPGSKATKEPAVAEGRAFETGNGKQNGISSNNQKNPSASSQDNVSEISTKNEKDDWLDGIEAPKPLAELELQDDSDDDDGVVETTTPSTFQLPVDLGRHLLEWLGALLGLTYGAYAKVAQAIKT